MFGGLTHRPAADLAARLVEITPADLERVFLCDSGSVSVEVALKMAIQYWQTRGERARRHILTVRGGYHGDTTGAMSVCDPVNGMHHLFADVLPERLFAPAPDCRYDTDFSEASVAGIREQLEAHPGEIAALIIEPLVQGAGGMRFHCPRYLQRVRELCDAHGVLLIFDEIATGFGRTGPMFACETEGVEPDFLACAKGLTAGYAPMGALLMSEKFYAGIANGKHKAAVLGHGQTYSAHPVSAAIALEVIRLYEDGLLENGRKMAPHFAKRLQEMRDHPLVGDARQIGLLGALELVADKTTKERFDPALNLSERISKIAYENGVIFRAFGDNILGFAPALCYTEEEFDILFDRVRKTLDTILNESDVKKAVK
jgi:adenosylmethionine-8-amino-7-oxononanoate transaminase